MEIIYFGRKNIVTFNVYFICAVEKNCKMLKEENKTKQCCIIS